MKPLLFSIIAFTSVVGLAAQADAHCQVPCGIYDDATVFATLHTDQQTISKAMEQIKALSGASAANTNQLTRWVLNKEKHAQAIQDTVARYFLAQRIKVDDKEKAKKLELLHQITVYAMKCKQTTDLENAQKLHDAITAFQQVYSKK